MRLENARLVMQLERVLQQSMVQQQQAMQAQLQLLQQQQPPPPPRTSPFEPQVGPSEPAQFGTMLAVQTWVSIWQLAAYQKIHDIVHACKKPCRRRWSPCCNTFPSVPRVSRLICVHKAPLRSLLLDKASCLRSQALYTSKKQGAQTQAAASQHMPECINAFVTQSAPSSFAPPATLAGQEVSDAGSDGGDTPVYMQPSSCLLPTVDEEGSQELTQELPEDQKRAGEIDTCILCR